MNKIILFCGLALFLALSAASDTQEDNSLSAGSSPIRQAREADPRRSRKKTKKRKSKGRRTSGRKTGAKKGQRKIKKKSGKGRKRSGRRNGRKKLAKKSRRKESRNTTSTSSLGVVCLSAAVKYMKQWKDVVGNFKRQNARSTKHSSVGSKKHDKKGVFAPAAHRLVEAGGDNKTNLSCAGEYGNDGALQLTNITKLLFDCEIDVNNSCNPANYPKHNDTKLATCVNLTETFEDEVGACMAKSVGKTSESDYAEACMCWESEELAAMSASVGDCKIQDTQKEITKQKTACTSAFAKCRKYEDEAISVLATCSQSKDKLTAKAAALSSNNQTLTAAKEKMSSLAGTSSRIVRQTATTCAEVISKSTQVISIVSQSTSSSKISVIALEISSVTSSVVCSADEKASLTTQISSVDSALDRIAEALTAVQEQLSTLTGSTADVSEPSVATSAPSGRRQRLLKSILNQ